MGNGLAPDQRFQNDSPPEEQAFDTFRKQLGRFRYTRELNSVGIWLGVFIHVNRTLRGGTHAYVVYVRNGWFGGQRSQMSLESE